MQAFVAKKFVETQRGLIRIKNSAAMAELIAQDGDVAA